MAWGLESEEESILLGRPRKRAYSGWKRDPDKALLGRDTLERISYILGIYKALQVLLPDPHAADAWVRTPATHASLGRGSALDRMLAGNVSDLYVMRGMLDRIQGTGG